MLIINADDFGRSRVATDRILSCYKRGSVTSTSAMVFMEDSLRAADLASKFSMDVGLHLNFTERFTQEVKNSLLANHHNCIIKFLMGKKYNFLMYNPALRKQFKCVFHAQLEEFERIFGKPPSHINGHHHMHLCTNMILENIIPKGQKIRRNFSFSRGEKSFFNLMYRATIDYWLARRYQMTDYFFSLSECIRSDRLTQALELAKTANVELETHPEQIEEFEWLMGKTHTQSVAHLLRGTYSQL